MAGPNIQINRFKDLSVSKAGSPINGLVSARYSLNRDVNNIFKLGSSNPVANYGSLPEIEVSYTGYANGSIGGFDVSEANTFTTISINGSNGGVSCGLAVLSSVRFDMSVDEPFTITKTFTGYSKPQGGEGGGGGSLLPYVIKRADYSGGLPSGISGNYLTKVSAEISISREIVGEFATRRPYASVVTYPIKQSITYDVIASAMDSVVIDDLYQACENPDSTKYDASIGACGIGYGISNAYVTSIEYGGGEASPNGSPQTISITYTSYDEIPRLKPIILFDQV